MLVPRSGALRSQVCRIGFAGSKVKRPGRYLKIVLCQTGHEKIAGRGVVQEPRRASPIMFGVRGRYLAIDDTKRLGLLEKSLLQLIKPDFVVFEAISGGMAIAQKVKLRCLRYICDAAVTIRRPRASTRIRFHVNSARLSITPSKPG